MKISAPCIIAGANTIAENMVARPIVHANRSPHPQPRSYFEGGVAVVAHLEIDFDGWLRSITFPQRGKCLFLTVKRERVLFAYALPPFVDNTGRLRTLSPPPRLHVLLFLY